MSSRRANSWLDRSFGLAALVLLVIVGARFALYFHSWRDTTPRGPLHTPQEWPEPIRDLHSKMSDAGIVAEPFEVFLVYGRPGSTLSTVVCRMPDSAEVVTFLKEAIGMLPEAGKNPRFLERVERELAARAPVGWWVEPQDETPIFVSKNVVEGGEGDMYVLAHDATRKLVYLYYYFNF
jgi:hypothetical protein